MWQQSRTVFREEGLSKIASGLNAATAPATDLPSIATPGTHGDRVAAVITGYFLAPAENYAPVLTIGATGILIVYNKYTVDLGAIIALFFSERFFYGKCPVGRPHIVSHHFEAYPETLPTTATTAHYNHDVGELTHFFGLPVAFFIQTVRHSNGALTTVS